MTFLQVFGAVTGELMAAAVAANEDVANSAALVYTQNTGNLALTIGRTIGASLSSQVIIPALTQTEAENSASTVPGLVTGELLAAAVAEFESGGGGGGGGSTDRIVLLDGETYSPGAARNFDFTEDIPARHLLTFEIVGTATGYAIMLSDDLLALTAQSGGPSTSANSYPMYTRNHSNSLPTQNQGNSWLVWREDADSIYFRESRGSGGTLTITATPLGGGLHPPADSKPLGTGEISFSGTSSPPGLRLLSSHSPLIGALCPGPLQPSLPSRKLTSTGSSWDFTSTAPLSIRLLSPARWSWKWGLPPIR